MLSADIFIDIFPLSRPTQRFLWQVQFAVENPRNEVEVIFGRKYVTMGSQPLVVTSGFLWLKL